MEFLKTIAGVMLWLVVLIGLGYACDIPVDDSFCAESLACEGWGR